MNRGRPSTEPCCTQLKSLHGETSLCCVTNSKTHRNRPETLVFNCDTLPQIFTRESVLLGKSSAFQNFEMALGYTVTLLKLFLISIGESVWTLLVLCLLLHCIFKDWFACLYLFKLIPALPLYCDRFGSQNTDIQYYTALFCMWPNNEPTCCAF